MASSNPADRANSPASFVNQIRHPIPSADPWTGLNCLLSNHFQNPSVENRLIPSRFFDQDGPVIIYQKFIRPTDPEVEAVGNTNLANFGIAKIFFTMSTSRYLDASGDRTFILKAELHHETENGIRIPAFTPAPMVFQIQSRILDRRARLLSPVPESWTWDQILRCIQRMAKIMYTQHGEHRSDDDRMRVDRELLETATPGDWCLSGLTSGGFENAVFENFRR